MKNEKLSFIIHVIGITLLAFLLSHSLLYDISSLSIFAPMEKANDFEMSDLYNSTLNRRAVKHKSDVIVVAIDSLSRSEVGDLIEIIGAQDPKAVGVDVLFTIPQPDDDILIAQIESCPHIVLANKMIKDNEKNLFNIQDGSYFENDVDVNYGVANLAADNSRDVVRTFKTQFRTVSGYAPSFALSMAQCILSDYQASDDGEIIYYPSVEIEIINGREILAGNHLSELKQGIIMIGDCDNINDSFLTPLDDEMPGVMIHAYELNTILGKQHITSTPRWLDWLIAVLVCLLFAAYNVFANRHLGNAGNIFLRIVQMGTLILMYMIGLLLFAHYNQYIDLSATLMMTTLGMLAADLWFGMYAGYKALKELILKRIRK